MSEQLQTINEKYSEACQLVGQAQYQVCVLNKEIKRLNKVIAKLQQEAKVLNEKEAAVKAAVDNAVDNERAHMFEQMLKDQEAEALAEKQCNEEEGNSNGE